MTKTRFDTADWRTHCVGRHLIDLPPDVQPSGMFKVAGVTLERQPFDGEAARKKLQLLEEKLKSNPPKTKDDQKFEQTVQWTPGSAAVVTSEDVFGKTRYELATYLATDDGNKVYDYKGRVSQLEPALALRQRFAQSLRSLAPNEIPTEAGFCIDGAILKYNELNAESWTLGFQVPSRPGFGMDFNVYVHGPQDDKPLLERTGGMMNRLLATVGGLSTLRRETHNVGPIEGEEILVAGNEDGQRLYSFRWEARGQDRSLSEPRFGVSLGVLQQASYLRPKNPPFKDDDEAMAFWDAVIDSIRLRPGAV